MKVDAKIRRRARRKLGSRSARRRGTNGKNVPGAPMGKGGRVAVKFTNPRPARRTVAVGVMKFINDLIKAQEQGLIK